MSEVEELEPNDKAERCGSAAIQNAPRAPKFLWSMQVRALTDLYNDGSYPKADKGVLLVTAGTIGEIVRVGHHAEANMPIYVVDFGEHVLGCAEVELASCDSLTPSSELKE